MDLYTWGLVIALGLGWLIGRLWKRRKAKVVEMTIFPPDRRRAVHVVETKDDLPSTF